MSEQIDIRVTVEGRVVPLCAEVATMILALVEHQENIHKQGGGNVGLDYNRHGNVSIALTRLNYRATVRTLTGRDTSSSGVVR